MAAAGSIGPIRRRGRFAALAALAALGVTTIVAAAPSAAQERERIAAERSAATSRYLEQEATCRQRFMAASCLSAARDEQRATLTRLRREELQLGDAERKAKSAERIQAIERKTNERESPRSGGKSGKLFDPADLAASRAEREPASANRAPKAARPDEPRRDERGLARRPAMSDAERREFEARNRAAFEARKREAEEHRLAVEKRNAERAAQRGKVAQPLPTPPSAASRPAPP